MRPPQAPRLGKEGEAKEGPWSRRWVDNIDQYVHPRAGVFTRGGAYLPASCRAFTSAKPARTGGPSQLGSKGSKAEGEDMAGVDALFGWC